MNERFKRKMSNEYERIGKHLNEVISENFDRKFKLSSIKVVGADRTSRNFLSRVFDPYLKDSEPKKFKEILSDATTITGKLGQFGIFNEIEPMLKESVIGGDDELDLLIRVKEASTKWLRTSTDVGDGEGSVVRILPPHVLRLGLELTF
jgi:outer membrane protein insertion porin family